MSKNAMSAGPVARLFISRYSRELDTAATITGRLLTVTTPLPTPSRGILPQVPPELLYSMLKALGGSYTATSVDLVQYSEHGQTMEVHQFADPYALQIRLTDNPGVVPRVIPPATPVTVRRKLPVGSNPAPGNIIFHEGYYYYYACVVWKGSQQWGWYDEICPHRIEQMVFTSDGRRIEYT